MYKVKFIFFVLILCSLIAKSQSNVIKKDSLYFNPKNLERDLSGQWDSMYRALSTNLPKDSMALKISRVLNIMDIRKILYKLSSDEFQGRETGYRGQKIAENYIAGQFKNFGLKPVGDSGTYIQNFNVVEDTLIKSNIEINKKKYSVFKDYYSYLRLNHSDSLETNKIYFAGYGIDSPEYSDYEAHDLNGKVVMISTGEPQLNDTTYLISGDKNQSSWSASWDMKLKAATKRGVAAIFVVIDGSIEDEVKSNSRIIRRPMRLSENKEYATFSNIFYISHSMASELFASAGKNYDATIKKMESKQKPVNETLKLQTKIDFKKESITLTSSNLVGIVEGTDKKDEVVIITAHYDHLGIHNGDIYHGADDDGSGTTAVMELAKAFAKSEKMGIKQHRTILFICFSGEEKGLLGSEFYTQHPLFPIENTVVDLNIDMIGRLDTTHERTNNPNYVYVIGDDKLSSELRPISEKANNTYLKMKLDYKYNSETDPNHYYSRSDHYNFAKKGIPIIFYFNGSHEDYHQPTDVIEKINFSKLYLTTQLIFYTAWDIANRDNRLKLDKK